jgi:hypothetical protein
MANEAVSFSAFRKRTAKIAPISWKRMSYSEQQAILTKAWQECAFISNLTDSRIILALYAHMPLAAL